MNACITAGSISAIFCDLYDVCDILAYGPVDCVWGSGYARNIWGKGRVLCWTEPAIFSRLSYDFPAFVENVNTTQYFQQVEFDV
jgi:hypothetical protein